MSFAYPPGTRVVLTRGGLTDDDGKPKVRGVIRRTFDPPLAGNPYVVEVRGHELLILRKEFELCRRKR